ncbi:cupin domain-containing protein [Haladaptatus sp. DFWS20]|uniref:cupin domain-containing protein n=1 Tax=Haladaptatus sp. DFWS20 TaxID=3403467 RepID=UPI003EC0B6F4
MKKISIDGVNADDPDIDRRKLSEPLGTTDVAINHYRLAPGEELPGGLHAHLDQEEVFVVLDGEATFETIDGRVTVESDEAIRFAPGEFQSGKNQSDTVLVVLAMGAPRDTDDVRFPLPCPTCGNDEIRFGMTDDELIFVCPECDAEHVPQPCPGCDHDDMRVTLGGGDGTIVVCQGCGAEFGTPPLR